MIFICVKKHWLSWKFPHQTYRNGFLVKNKLIKSWHDLWVEIKTESLFEFFLRKKRQLATTSNFEPSHFCNRRCFKRWYFFYKTLPLQGSFYFFQFRNFLRKWAEKKHFKESVSFDTHSSTSLPDFDTVLNFHFLENLSIFSQKPVLRFWTFWGNYLIQSHFMKTLFHFGGKKSHVHSHFWKPRWWL